jgi:hypothetical protein
MNVIARSLACGNRRGRALAAAIMFLWMVASGLVPGAACALPQRYSADRAYFTVAPTPDWVRPADISPEALAPRDTGQSVAYLLTDRQIRIQGDTGTRYVRRVVRPLTESGLESVAEIEIDFDPACERLAIHALSVYRAGKLYNRLRPDQVRLIQRERDLDQKLYDGTVTALIILDDVRVNDVIDIAYSVDGRNPVFGDKYFSSFALGWNVAVERASVRIVMPRSRRLHTRTYHIDLEPTVSVHGDTREYLWVRNAVPAVIDEGDYPDWYQPYPWLQVSEYRNWTEVADWAAALYTWKGDLDPALLRQIAQWRAPDIPLAEAVRRALRFVQGEIRYLGIELGQNSHRPAHPNDVFARRYGDCKDKALLLSAILNEMGISARPSLVATKHGRVLAERLAGPGLFDHVIVINMVPSRPWAFPTMVMPW